MSSDYEKEFLRVVDEESLKKNMIKTLNASSGSDTEKSFELEDGWGGKIYYRYPGQINRGGFDLIAPGADGRFGSGNATTPPTARTSYYSTDNHELLTVRQRSARHGEAGRFSFEEVVLCILELALLHLDVA